MGNCAGNVVPSARGFDWVRSPPVVSKSALATQVGGDAGSAPNAVKSPESNVPEMIRTADRQGAGQVEPGAIAPERPVRVDEEVEAEQGIARETNEIGPPG